jgi:hypothetical protein
MLLIFLSLLVLIYFIFRIRAANKEEAIEKEWEQKKIALFTALNELDCFDPNGYSGATNHHISSLQKEIHNLLDEMMKRYTTKLYAYYGQKIGDLQEKASVFQATLSSAISEWETAEKKWESLREEIHTLFENTHFYPPSFTHQAFHLEEAYKTSRTKRREDPLSSPDSFKKTIATLETSLHTFLRLQHEVLSLVSTAQLSDETKHTLITDLQNERYEAVENRLKKVFLSTHKEENET